MPTPAATAPAAWWAPLVATKAKIKFSWNALSWQEAAKIKNAIYGKGFTTCTYPGVDGQTHTVTGYFGTPQLQPVQLAGGTPVGHLHHREFH